MTRDIDIVIELNEQDIKRLHAAFRASYYVDEQMILESYQKCLPFNLIHLTSVTKIDFIPRKETEYYSAANAALSYQQSAVSLQLKAGGTLRAQVDHHR